MCIEASGDEVWARLAVREEIQLRAEPISHVSCGGGLIRGMGAERTCELVNNTVIQERWLGWEEGRFFRYEASGVPLARRASNRWSLWAAGAGRTLLTTEAALELKGGLLGALLAPLMAAIMRRMGRNSLAGFKYFVAHGHPYPGPQSELPQAPAGC